MTSETPADARKGSRTVLGDGAITVAERVISQAAQFAIFIVAARVLGPAEFGLFALVSACAILLFRVSEFGWAPFIMAWSGEARVPRQVLFIAMICGTAISLLGILGARIGGGLGLAADTVLLMEYFAIWVALATVSSAQKGILIWQHRMKASAICEIAGELVGIGVAVGALLQGQGVLSLAYGRLAYQGTHLGLSFACTRMVPLPGLRGQVLRDLWTFSTQIFVSRMFIYVRLYLATFIVGGFLGTTAVGYYRAADRLVSAVAEIIAVPGQLLAWTRLRLARDGGDEAGQSDRLRRELRAFMKMLFAISAPVFLWLICMSDELIHGLLSAEWQAAAPLVAILALSRLFFLFGLLTEPVMSVSGHARALPVFTGLVFALSTALTFGAVHLGLYALAWAQVLIAGLVMLATLWLFNRYVGVTPREIVTDIWRAVFPLALGTGVLVALDQGTATMGLPDLLEAIGFGLVALGTYLVAIWRLDPALWAAMSSGFRKRVMS